MKRGCVSLLRSPAAAPRGASSPRSSHAPLAPDSPGANLLSRFGLSGASAPPPRVPAAAPGAPPLTGIIGFLAQQAPAALGGAHDALVGAFGSSSAAAMQRGAQGGAAVPLLAPFAPPSPSRARALAALGRLGPDVSFSAVAATLFSAPGSSAAPANAASRRPPATCGE